MGLRTSSTRFTSGERRAGMAAAFALVVGGVARLPYYDLSWFGWDEAYFLAEARRVAGGDFGVTGPLASGANVVGPLYSFLLGGLLWIGGDATFLALCNALLELVAIGLVFASARRVGGLVGAVAAATTYACVPVLVLSTRMLWNPSWLPALVVLGWWLVLRCVESPTRAAIVGVGLAAGAAPALHATGVLHSVGWALAIVLIRPGLGRLCLGTVAAIVPMLPVLAYTLSGRIEAAAAQPLVTIRGLNDVSSALNSMRALIAGFPLAIADGLPLGTLSTFAFHAVGLLSLVGIALGLGRRGPHRAVWLGIVATATLFVAAVSVYSRHLLWYYFMPLVGPMCLGLARAVSALAPPLVQRTAAVVIAGTAVVHLLFVWEFDRRTESAGYLRLDGRGLAAFNQHSVWRQLGAPAHSIPLRRQRALAEALKSVVPGGTTALQVAHGARAELWRATGAEFMAADEPTPTPWPWQFIIMGRDTRTTAHSAFVRGNDVCVFDRVGDPSWTVHAGPAPPEWDSPLFDARQWSTLALPQRIASRAQAGPVLMQVDWQAKTVQLRGMVDRDKDAPAQHLYAVTVHGAYQHAITLSVNGTAVPVRRTRLLASDIFRSEEWLFDLGPLLEIGTNVVALQVSGPSSVFDLDVFRVPCVDSDWYY